MKKIIGFIVCILLITFTGLSTAESISLGAIKNNNAYIRITQEEKSAISKIEDLDSPDDFIIDIIQQINETMYLGYLENITAFGPRVTGTTECYEVGDYIYNEFESMDLEVRFHNWNYEGYQDRNIEATLHGTNQTSDEIYIVCAHFDSVAGSPGADDNGGGVAAVMSAANILSQYPFNHTVRFIAFSGEEQWMLGSHEYVREAYENEDNIIAVLNCDMIGFALNSTHGSNINLFSNTDSEWICEFTINASQDYFDYIQLIINLMGPKPGEQTSFWEYGYDCILNQEYEFNYYYHSPQDIIENMNITYAVKCSKLVIATLARFAQLSSIPPNIPTISGPANGITRTEYDFTVVTTDPDDDNVYYNIDWGDDTNSGWIGPYASGEEGIISHTWTSPGTYEIRAKAKDINEVGSRWSDPFIINIIKGPTPEIGPIKGGLFKISASIKNTGAVDATDVNWSITLKGGAFIGKSTEGSGLGISANGSEIITSKFVFGFGPTVVTVNAWIPESSDKREQSGFLFLFFIKVNPGG